MSNRIDERKDLMNQEQDSITKSPLMGDNVEVGQRNWSVTTENGSLEIFNNDLITRAIAWAQKGHEEETDALLLLDETIRNCFDKITLKELADAQILSAVAFIERDSS